MAIVWNQHLRARAKASKCKVRTDFHILLIGWGICWVFPAVISRRETKSEDSKITSATVARRHMLPPPQGFRAEIVFQFLASASVC